MKEKQGVLLINLGTPNSTKTSDVRKYLKEFLSDPRVIDINAIGRWLLLNIIILPLRPFKTAKAYKTIWNEHGSPLLYYSKQLVLKLKHKLSANNYEIALGMRYGNPSIKTAIQQLENCQTITIIPLFPQYSSAATGSALEESLSVIAKQWNIPNIKLLADFYNHPAYIKALTTHINKFLQSVAWEYLLFSYHGVPVRHVLKSDKNKACNQNKPCADINDNNRFCYRAQCFATTHIVAKHLKLTNEQYGVSFQSRLGRSPWIKPYTDEIFSNLIAQGVKKLVVVCPSFVADCLETLEEIAIRGKETWQNLGGESLQLIPCLNYADYWVESLAAIIKDQ